jgi:hypothetical protein
MLPWPHGVRPPRRLVLRGDAPRVSSHFFSDVIYRLDLKGGITPQIVPATAYYTAARRHAQAACAVLSHQSFSLLLSRKGAPLFIP